MGTEGWRVLRGSPGGVTAFLGVAVYLMLAGGVVQAQGRPTLTGSVDMQTVEIGQTLTYTLRLEMVGQGNVERLERPDFAGFSVLGQSKGTEFRSVGGQTQLNYTFSFQIQALSEGLMTISPARATIGGKQLEGNPVTVKISPRGEETPRPESASTGSAVFALVEVSERRPYVGSQVQVSYKLFLDERQVGPFGAELSALVEPSFDGFWIEDVEMRDNRLGTNEVIDGRRYKVQTIKGLAVFPLKTGELTIAPLEMEINASTRSSLRRQNIKVETKPVVMEVKPLPEGAPAGFDPSNVGQYRFEVEVDKQKVAVGEPFTVRLQVAGAGMVRRVEMPKLTTLGSARVLEPVFDKTSKAAGQLMGGTKAAEIVVTPVEEGVLQVPELAFHFFDPIEDKYKTITSPPKVVRVIGRSTEMEREVDLIEREEADQPEAMKVAKMPFMPLRPLSEVERGDPPRVSILGAPWFVLGMLAPPLGLLGWIAVGFARRRREEGSDERWRGSAPERADEALKAARGKAERGELGQAAGEVSAALTRYLSERLELPPGALSASRLKARLDELGVEESVIGGLLEVRRRCDEARFSALSEGDVDALVKQALEVFEALRGKV